LPKKSFFTRLQQRLCAIEQRLSAVCRLITPPIIDLTLWTNDENDHSFRILGTRHCRAFNKCGFTHRFRWARWHCIIAEVRWKR
jgi:hypothetical protein